MDIRQHVELFLRIGKSRSCELAAGLFNTGKRLRQSKSRSRFQSLKPESLEPRYLLSSDLVWALDAGTEDVGASVDGRVWNDANGDGIRGPSEIGFGAAVVSLYKSTDAIVGDADDVLVTTSLLDQSGQYSFAGLDAGNYYLGIRLPRGFSFAPSNIGTVESVDSDIDAATGRSSLFTMGTEPVVLDAGVNGEAPQFGWAATITGNLSGSGLGIAYDSNGNVFTTGRLRGTADFDPGPGSLLLTSAGSTNDDIFVAKYNSSGALIWAVRAGSTSTDGGVLPAIAVDSQGNVIVSGLFQGTADFDPGPGTLNLISAGTSDVFVWKIDSTGNTVWARRAGASGFDQGYGLAVDSQDNVLIAGFFMGTVDFDPGASTANLTSAGSWDGYVWKLDSQGNYLWARRVGSTDVDRVTAIAVDALNNVYLTGEFSGTVDFDPGSATTTSRSAGDLDLFAWKLDSAGNFVSVRAAGGTGTDRGSGIAIDALGNLILAGSFEGTADFDPSASTANVSSSGGTDVFTWKLSADGNLLWIRTAGGSADDSTDGGVSVGSDGSVVTGGHFENTISFQPGVARWDFTSVGGEDAFIWKLDAVGNFVWAHGYGSALNDGTRGLAVDSLGNLLASAYLGGTVDLDPSGATYSVTSGGDIDAVFFRWNASVASAPYAVVVGATKMSEDQPSSPSIVVRSAAFDLLDTLFYKITGVTDGALYLSDGTTPILSGGFISAAQGLAGVRFKPALNFNGITSFQIQASQSSDDAGLYGATTTSSVTVLPVNDAPSLSTNLGLTLAEGATVVLNGTRLKTNDVDNTTAQLLYSVTNLPTHGTLNLNGATLLTNGTFTQADLDAGRVTYTHDSSENFTDQFRFTVSDGEFTLSIATFAITITQVNDAPTAGANLGLTLAEGATAVIGGGLLKTNDVDNTAAQLVYTVTNLPTHGTLNLSGAALPTNGNFTQADLNAGRLTYVHDSGEDSTDNFNFTVTDGELTLSIATFAITITPINDAPTVGANLGVTLGEGGTVEIGGSTLKTNDVDNTTAQLLYSVTNLPTHGTLNLSGATLSANGTFTQADLDAGRVTYTHDSSENFTDNFILVVSDGDISLEATAFQIHIVPVNDPPTLAAQTFILSSSAKNGTAVGTVLMGDPDGPTKTFTLLGANGAFAIDSLTGVVTVSNQKALVVGTTNLVVRVVDNGDPSLAAEAMVTFIIRKSNTPPTFTLLDAYEIPTTVKSNNATLLLYENTPTSPSQNGALVGTVAARDIDEPGITLPTVMTDRSGAFAFDASTGRITIADSSKLNFEKTSSFTLTFKVVDHSIVGLPNVATATLSVTIKLVDRNEAPTFPASSATFRIQENNSARVTVGTVAATDPDKTAPNKTLTYALVSQVDQSGNAVGVFAIADSRTGKITVPTAGALNFEAAQSYTLTVRATDGLGLFQDTVVSVTVVDVNEAATVTLLDASRNTVTTLTISENAAAGSLIGYLRIASPDVFRSETFKISLNDSSGALVTGPYDAATGLVAITVSTDPKRAAKLDFEKFKLGRFALSATVSDSGFVSNDGSKQVAKSSPKATYTVQLQDVVGA